MSTWLELKNNPRLKKIYETRLLITRLTREFFWSLGFSEAETPLAVGYPGQEPYLNPVPVVFEEPNKTKHNFYLHTSPEFSLKKLLAAGFSKVFEITKTFRNNEDLRGLHSPEFTMIEWYRAPGSLEGIMSDAENLFKSIARKLNQNFVEYNNKKISISREWEKKTMREIWQEYLQVNLDDYLEVEPLQELAVKLGLALGGEQKNKAKYEDLFFKIFLNKIEPHLGLEQPIFIYDYPSRFCSLSRLSRPDSRYAERFELYIGGLEIANAFGELTAADEQNRRLEKDKALRASLGKPTWPVDPDFIAALKSGIPEAGGIALGVDRMVLLFTGAKDINEVIFNSVYDQIN
ncbi:MAG: EF-P lysine aminoacylase EpmA [Candidatus Magasanikbacteria bacterium]|nr:EF-P lysine aminoacylase EpmA [Candidatus Magasanikbacteria bacterium]